MKTGKQLFAGILIGAIIGLAVSKVSPGRYQVHVNGADIVKWDTWTGNVWIWNSTTNGPTWFLLSK
jgi:hypothetical protein